LRANYPLSPDSPQPAARVLRTGRLELLEAITPDVLTTHTRNDAHARLIAAIGMKSHLALPMVARGQTVGVIGFGISESERRYAEDDVALARDLARRAALAIDNARLYQQAQGELAERSRAEDALRLSEARFRAIMDQSPLSTQILDAHGVTIRVNPAFEALWGLTFEQLTGYRMLDDPQLENRGITPLLRRAFAGEPVDLPAIRYDPDETLPARSHHPNPVRWVRAFAYPVKDGSGGVREVVLVHEDVTDLKRAEETTQLLADAGGTLGASLDYRASLRDLVRLLIPARADWCAIDLVDDAGSLERVAAAHGDGIGGSRAAEVFGRFAPRRGDPCGPWHVLETGRADWIARLADADLEALAHTPEHLAELQALRPQSIISVPLTARGVSFGALTLLYAGSGRQHAASDLDLAMDLARRTAAAVDNARLVHRLKEEDRRKDEFLATLAHELRNPLAPIRTGLALLRVSTDPAVGERTRQMMERQLGHMVRLIDDLLDLSRVTQGKVQLEKERLDLWSLVNTALETSRPVLDSAGLQLAVRLPEAHILIDADRTRLAQVLGNLLHNAAKFTAPGGRVEITAAEDGGDVLISVADSGIGIAREMLTAIFEMFAQVDDAGNRAHGGLGIGLTLVRRLVELHGGQVWAHSAGLGHGSTFVVRLPRASTTAAAAPPAAPGDDVSRAAPASARRVIVVDDNDDGAEMLATLLELDGHEVRTASSGHAALDVMRDFHPDVAFLDVGMPGMSGHELARRMRATPHLAGVTIVALTGWGQDDDRRRSADAGMDRHLTKPVDPDEVRAIVATIATAGGSRRDPGSS
jgi:signal transduction histidine kinase/PAS domain-containing protein/ActR/RegA family two-component response regulator